MDRTSCLTFSHPRIPHHSTNNKRELSLNIVLTNQAEILSVRYYLILLLHFLDFIGLSHPDNKIPMSLLNTECFIQQKL